MLDLLAAPGPLSIQDGGRPGFRHLGVPLSGALDPELLAIANALTGNAHHLAALELRLAGPSLVAAAPVVVALAGALDAKIERVDGSRAPAVAWRGHSLDAGEALHVGAIRGGVAYLAVAGGFDTDLALGSRSTYPRASLGGINGRAPRAGDSLKVSPGGTALLRHLPSPPRPADGPLRILRGPQHDRFTEAAWGNLLDAEFVVSHEADRMGLRLDGPSLTNAGAADVVSEAVTPGVIQVPGDGRPIVLLADCQTVGGYAKIACVIGADLPRLAHALPGARLRFAAVTLDQARAARREAAERLAATLAAITPLAEGPDLAALYAANLIDGVIDAT